MDEVTGTIFSGAFSNLLDSFTNSSPLFVLLFFTAVIVAYAVFVFYFYKILAKKNLVDLNLSKYNNSSNAGFSKILAVIFYILEYLIIMPVLTFVWFTVLAILILILTDSLAISTVLVLSAALVASVRVTSYISQQLSQDLAKMLPFTLLALALTQPEFFQISSFLERLVEIPQLIVAIPYYLIFIVAVELIMRIGNFTTKIFEGDEINTEKEDKEEKQEQAQ